MHHKAVISSQSKISQGDFSYLTQWRLRGIAVLRIVFGCVWAIDAGFKWQPAFANNFTGYLINALDGQPPIVAAWIHFWLKIVTVNPHFFAHLIAVGETCIALGLLLGVLSNLTYVVGILLSFMIWSTAQGFGGPYGPSSTDIGVSIIYVLVFIGLFLSRAGLTFGLDHYLATKLGRWSLLASGQVKPQTVTTYPAYHYPIPRPPAAYPQMFIQHSGSQGPQEMISSAANTSHPRLNGVKRRRLLPMR